jgi:signal-transduction protein with cAMP-binding, CBS, and nucleotidyltransferase domain
METHAGLMERILRQQLADLDSGARPSSRVAVQGMSRADTKWLADRLRRIAAIQRSIRAAVSG